MKKLGEIINSPWVVIPIIIIFLIDYLYRKDYWGIVTWLSSGVITWFTFKFIKKIKKEDRRKYALTVRNAALLVLGIILLTGKYIKINSWFLTTSIMVVVGCNFILKESKAKKAEELQARINGDLNISTRKVKTSKLPKWIGGFVMPLFPMFFVINNKWKNSKEAIIHENVHLHYLQQGWAIAFLFVCAIPILLINMVFPGFSDTLYKDMILCIFSIAAMVYFEYVTFNKTYEYGKKLNIETRQWNKEICWGYIKIYTLSTTIIFVLYTLVMWLITTFI